jgi:uncharacterized protein YqhQ
MVEENEPSQQAAAEKKDQKFAMIVGVAVTGVALVAGAALVPTVVAAGVAGGATVALRRALRWIGS